MRYFDIEDETFGLTIVKGGITKAYTIWNDCSQSISANFAHDEDELTALSDWNNDIEMEFTTVKDTANELEKQAHYLLKKVKELREQEGMLRKFHSAIDRVCYYLDPATGNELDKIIEEVDSE